MKGFIEHLIVENEKLEQELTADYEVAHAPVSHRELLALQLRGHVDELTVCIHDCVSLKPMVEGIPPALLEQAEHILTQQQAEGIRTVSFADPFSYPERLADLDIFRPLLLHGIGNWGLLDQLQTVAIVGPQGASPQELAAVRVLGKEYGSTLEGPAPFVLVSGLVEACDVAAIEGCLEAGGEVIGVTGSIRDAGSSTLCRRIVDEGGLVLSENATGLPLTRAAGSPDRIIAALSAQILVTVCQEPPRSVIEEARKLGREIRLATPFLEI